MTTPKDWEITHEERLLSTPIFNTQRVRARSPRTQREHQFMRLVSPGWVNVIPITETRDVVMVRQYRHGTRELTLEIPGGMVDPGETPIEAGARELLEETGYAAPQLLPLGHVHPNPALFDNACHTFLAEGTVQVADMQPQGSEDIGLELHALADIPRLIRSGVITHALVIAAFHWLALHEPGQP